MDRAPHHLLPDLIALAPKMVERDEHVAIAASLVGRLSSPETDLSLRLPLLASVSHLEVGAEAWEQVLAHGLELMQVGMLSCMEGQGNSFDSDTGGWFGNGLGFSKPGTKFVSAKLLGSQTISIVE